MLLATAVPVFSVVKLAYAGCGAYISLMRILFFLFVLVPLAELYVLIEVGSGIGGLATIGLCLLTAAIGGLLIRIQGIQTLLKARQSIRQHELAEQGLHGLMLVIAGLLLFTPGFITDTLGFVLLVPAVRKALIRHVYAPYVVRSTSAHHRYPHVDIIDVEVIKKDD